VVVSGFYPSATARESVLQLFLSFGDIQDHVVTPGNWLFIRYVSCIAPRIEVARARLAMPEPAGHCHFAAVRATRVLSECIA
jgi:hypothetical protein